MLLGFSLENKYDLPLAQVISLLKKEGFSAVSPVWSQELDLSSLTDYVQKAGMQIQSLHAPHKNIATLWEPDSETGKAAQANILLCLQDCERFGIPIMVLHCWQGHNYVFEKGALDFRLFDEVFQLAEKLGVQIALENLEGEEFLAALMERYRHMSCVGFCWDAGHDHCYPHKTDFLQAYGDRLIMTHMNDNLGIRDPGGEPSKFDDLHFLPGDGTVDWSSAITALAGAPTQQILNFELKKTAKSNAHEDLLYEDLTTEEYFALAGARAKQIAALYAAAKN